MITTSHFIPTFHFYRNKQHASEDYAKLRGRNEDTALTGSKSTREDRPESSSAPLGSEEREERLDDLIACAFQELSVRDDGSMPPSGPGRSLGTMKRR
uniref:Uncharacterized protein n=1 Tax=Steinernema glaseri TaxID=37863 RepID=A0A1I7ZF62_9BILA